MESGLLNAVRGNIKELNEDYLDYIGSHKLALWDNSHPRYQAMQEFCRLHNRIDDYEPYFERWSDEEMSNRRLRSAVWLTP